MPLRLFGAGSTRVRSCPACERKIKADAAFCPSCYMVFRSEGSAALREYLQGARIPADVYLLRKMQSEDPNAGPVTRAPAAQPSAAQGGPVPVSSPEPPPAPSVASPPSPSGPTTPPPPAVESAAPHPIPPSVEAPSVAEQPRVETGSAPKNGPGDPHRAKTRNGVEGLLTFREPLPPLAVSAGDIPGLFVWMLEKDPLIPNNLTRLADIHAAVFQGTPPARLGYEQHLLLQVTEDLGLYGTKESLGFHLTQLAAAYRRASEAYRKTPPDGSQAINAALWRMASLASRLRMEAWVYHGLHGEPPQLPSTRQRELPLKFSGK
jgi:hypothetical protein